MSIELLTSKLFIPPLRPNLVPRPRLVERLNSGLEKQLTLISAPAGFGKTTLVAAWLKQLDRPAAWLSLEEADNDLPRFMAYLAAALQQVDEGLGAPLLSALQSPQPPAMSKALAATLNEIALRNDPLVVVLDDYHSLYDSAILQVMEFLLQHQPPQLHLALTTREDPDLPLARLRACDQLSEIRAWDLRFSRAETEAFLRGVMGLALSAQEVATLDDRTEGWVVGLQLAGLSLQRQADIKAFITDFSGSNRHILDYLTDEVLQRQPEGVRFFLLQTAILDRLSGSLCDALTGRTDSNRLLAQLEAANLFVIPLDEERRWYRYHHLFSDLLRNQLARSQPELISQLHRRASRWYAENGDIQAAIDHALQDTDLTQAADLIEKYTFPKLYRGEVAMVIGWFDRLPEAILQPNPMLCICKAWALVLMQRGARSEEVERALQAANQALDHVQAGEVLRDLVAGHAASVQAFLLRRPALLGRYPEKLIALSQEAQRLLPAGEKGIRSATALNMGYGYQALANLKAASQAFNQALEDGLSGGNFYAAIYGPINLAHGELLVGRLGEALQLCEKYIERFNRIQAGQYFPPIGALYILKGSILVEYDHLLEAEQVLTEGLDLVRWTGEAGAPKRGYSALARLRAIQGDRPAMLESLKTLEEIWPEGSLYVQALRQRLSIRDLPEAPGVREDAHTWLAHSEIWFDELEVIDRFDPISTSKYETYLNTAHVLAHLARGEPGAYPLAGAQAYLKRQQEIAGSHGFVSWVAEIGIARSLLYQAAGNKREALAALQTALDAAVGTGLLRSFVDECDPMQALLEELKPRLIASALIVYAGRLLEAMHCGAAKSETSEGYREPLSARELEVLRCLAMGLSYQEIGQRLFLSLNTVQFHIKNVYRKLLVNKRAQAIDKARELNLI